MSSQSDIDNQNVLLTTHRRRLSELLKQQALYGSAAEPHIHLEIDDERQHIAHIKAVLQGWEVVVEEHPNDIARPSVTYDSPRRTTPEQKMHTSVLVMVGVLGLITFVAVALFWFRSTPPNLSRLEFRRTGDAINAFLSADTDQYALLWGSDGSPSGASKPWSSSQQPAPLQGVRDLKLFKDATDPDERMWIHLTLMRGSGKREYQIALHLDGKTGLICDPAPEASLVAITPCVFQEH